MAPAHPNGSSSTEQHTLDSDVALLQSLLAQDEHDTSDSDVVELLRRLESADGIATGLESRLNDIIGSLDAMLGNLEPQGQVSERELPIVRQGVVVEEEEIAVAATESSGEQPEKGQ